MLRLSFTLDLYLLLKYIISPPLSLQFFVLNNHNHVMRIGIGLLFLLSVFCKHITLNLKLLLLSSSIKAN